MQRDQGRVRVNAQLIDAQSGAHLWADRFEDDVADLFKLQDEVVDRLANSLGNELVKAGARGGRRIANLDAFDLTMRGRALRFEFLRRPTREVNNAARALFEQALAINPEDAGALAGDAVTYLLEKTVGWGSADVDYDAKILGQADRSIAIAPNDPEPYNIKSLYLSYVLHRTEEGLRAAEAGLALKSRLRAPVPCKRQRQKPARDVRGGKIRHIACHSTQPSRSGLGSLVRHIGRI